MFWKKKDKKEASDSSSVSSNPFESSSMTSGSSVDNKYNDSYNNSQAPPSGGRYGNYQQNREDLLGSRPPPSSASRQYDSQGNEDVYGNRNRSRYGEDDEDEEVGGLKKQIRDVKQDTLQSTRNALQKITEAQDSAAQSMNMLGNQSGQIANINRNLDLAKAHADRASTQADELKQLNRSIFIPVVKNPFNKGARQQREIEKLQKNHAEHMEERDEIRKFEYESNARIDAANRQNQSSGGYRRGGGRTQADRNRYQFEADEEDDAIEDEIDHNVDLLGNIAGNLKTMALTMNDELDSQLKQIDKATKKTTPVTEKLMRTTYTLDNTR